MALEKEWQHQMAEKFYQQEEEKAEKFCQHNFSILCYYRPH
jgi:hypothetical protein